MIAYNKMLPEFEDSGQLEEWTDAVEGDLVAMSEEERVAVLVSLVGDFADRGANMRPLFTIANKVFGQRSSYRHFLRAGLRVADATSIKYWLEFSIRRLGLARVLRLLMDLPANYSPAVSKALYWLPSFATNSRERLMIQQFTKTFEP